MKPSREMVRMLAAIDGPPDKPGGVLVLTETKYSKWIHVRLWMETANMHVFRALVRMKYVEEYYRNKTADLMQYSQETRKHELCDQWFTVLFRITDAGRVVVKENSIHYFGRPPVLNRFQIVLCCAKVKVREAKRRVTRNKGHVTCRGCLDELREIEVKTQEERWQNKGV